MISACALSQAVDGAYADASMKLVVFVVSLEPHSESDYIMLVEPYSSPRHRPTILTR